MKPVEHGGMNEAGQAADFPKKLKLSTVGAVYDRAHSFDSKPFMVQARQIVRGHRPRLQWELIIRNDLAGLISPVPAVGGAANFLHQ